MGGGAFVSTGALMSSLGMLSVGVVLCSFCLAGSYSGHGLCLVDVLFVDAVDVVQCR